MGQPQKGQARGGVTEDELCELVNEGLSIAQIAVRVDLSKTGVRYWLKRYGLKTHNPGPQRSELAAEAKRNGLTELQLRCRHHGETMFILEGRGFFRCKRCRADRVTRRRRKMKEILIAEAGGRCAICGYDKHPCALAFHHLDPMTKRMPVSANGISYALDTLRAEADKCVLLCANCHAEVENGVAVLPLE